MTPYEKKVILAWTLSELWDDNEKVMGEMAAYHVACEQLEIDPDDGWELLEMIGE